ncbi:competence type IV pilus minor pilin ComGD [Bacillus thermotolerans]|uniref:competence type IV pilus minor pilin ComGD n=1 Tax=Bacillus thermotolerans TaxID=1221996 RepID=UPI0006964556|nr:competence type IV pilus minor pilin ComGD [Bacillus thermotolerans]
MFHKVFFSLQKDRGFSMLEVLLVLSVMLVLLSVLVLPLPKLTASAEKNQFFYQLQADLFFAQSYAISRQERVEVRFSSNPQGYTVHSLSGSSLSLHRTMPQSVTYIAGSLSKMTFLPNGNTIEFGLLRFMHRGESISYVVQIGKGRFYVQKE